MATFNPSVDYKGELKSLRETYVRSMPRARLGIIERRLSHEEIGPVKMCSLVSAVEALARSIVVHWPDQGASVSALYDKNRLAGPTFLVEKSLGMAGLPKPEVHFGSDTWVLFGLAVDFRNLVMHECTYLGQDKFQSLIAASDEVLRELTKVVDTRW